MSFKSIEKIIFAYTGLGALIAFYYWPSQPIVAGIIAGGFVAWVNLKVLGGIVSRLTGAQAGSSSSIATGGIFLVVKMLLLMAVVALLLLVVGLNPIAFAVGFAAVVVGICIEGMRAALPKN